MLAEEGTLSLAGAAGRLGVDRTTVAALVDGLEDHGLVERRRSPRDRRRNTVRLTAAGLVCPERGEGRAGPRSAGSPPRWSSRRRPRCCGRRGGSSSRSRR
ncbi:MarR family winged helix-turn-helix transcriptional regulator [Streptomyces sp. Root1310]|uniref:MarR family winged helix-turn-helix transcriptional regulator n=1 Tax=Streptomyces sp. Root1310 TaxID=1736452 RepID=UPI001F5BAE95|nr:MarR family winged helix-turn-helix transcriptional regulator [Streptomyces sp. Root1310]